MPRPTTRPCAENPHHRPHEAADALPGRRLTVCTGCSGPLRDADGHYHERLVEDGGKGWAEAVCCQCAGHKNRQEAQHRASPVEVAPMPMNSQPLLFPLPLGGARPGRRGAG